MIYRAVPSSLAIAAILASGAAFAGAGPYNLSDSEKASINSLLDTIASGTRSDLASAIVRELDNVEATGKNGDAVIITVKLGARTKLDFFQGALLDLCLHEGGAAYCRFAALEAPQPGGAPVREAGAAGGGAGGPQTNFGHNSESYVPASPQIAGASAPQRFSGGAALNVAASNSRLPQRILTFSAPAPEAGRSLSALVLLASFSLSARRFLRGNKSVNAKG